MKMNIALLLEQSVNVIDSLNRGFRLTEEEQCFFCEHFKRMEIKKNDFIVRIGEYENYLYFIENGIVRYWSISNRKGENREITSWFSFPGEFAGSFFSIKRRFPSPVNIQALSDGVVWKLSKERLISLYQTSLNANKMSRIILEDILIRKMERELLLLSFSPEERYKDLMLKEKALITQIPLKYLASYIGVTPQTLSVIRKKTK